jgi:hypothetical protein
MLTCNEFMDITKRSNYNIPNLLKLSKDRVLIKFDPNDKIKN